MPVFKFKATIYVKEKTDDSASSEVHDILRHAVKNYSAFVEYHVDDCEQLDQYYDDGACDDDYDEGDIK